MLLLLYTSVTFANIKATQSIYTSNTHKPVLKPRFESLFQMLSLSAGVIGSDSDTAGEA